MHGGDTYDGCGREEARLSLLRLGHPRALAAAVVVEQTDANANASAATSGRTLRMAERSDSALLTLNTTVAKKF